MKLTGLVTKLFMLFTIMIWPKATNGHRSINLKTDCKYLLKENKK